VFGPGSALPTPSDALDLFFRDAGAKKNLSDFAVAKEMRRGVGSAVVDALVVQPKVAGVGIDIAKLARFFKGGRYR